MTMDEMENPVDIFYLSANIVMSLKDHPLDTPVDAKAEMAFKFLLDSPKCSTIDSKIKAMIAGIIPKYVQYFPSLQEMALNSQIDFCEYDDLSVRKASMRILPTFSTNVPKYASRVTDVLIQLLQCGLEDELKEVRQSLLSLFKTFPKDAILAAFHQIEGGTSNVRDSVCIFMLQDLLPISSVQMKAKILNKFTSISENLEVSDCIARLVSELLKIEDVYQKIDKADGLNILMLKTLVYLDAENADDQKDYILVIFERYTSLFQQIDMDKMNCDQLILYIIKKLSDSKSAVKFNGPEEMKILKIFAGVVSNLKSPSILGEALNAIESLLQKIVTEFPQDKKLNMSFFKLEPLLFALLYYRSKDESANKRNSSELQITLTKCLEIVQNSSKYVEDFAKIDASKYQKMKLCSDNLVVFCKELLHGKLMVPSNNLKLSWNCLPKIEIKKVEPKAQPLPKKPKGPAKAQAKQLVEKKKLTENLLAAKTKKNKANKKQVKANPIVATVAKQMNQKKSKTQIQPQNVNIQRETAKESQNNEKRQKLIQKFGKNSSVLKFISSKTESGVSKKTQRGPNVKFTVIRQQVGGDNRLRQVVRK